MDRRLNSTGKCARKSPKPTFDSSVSGKHRSSSANAEHRKSRRIFAWQADFADLFPYITQCNEDPYMMITTAQVKLNSSSIQQILDCVENKLLDTLLILEEAFGPLYELDISIAETDVEDSNKVVEQIIFNIYDDHSVTIGEKASVKDTVIK